MARAHPLAVQESRQSTGGDARIVAGIAPAHARALAPTAKDTALAGAALARAACRFRRPPEFIRFESHRQYVRQVVANEVQLRKRGTEFVEASEEGESSIACRNALNAQGPPSRTVSETYAWTSGTEPVRDSAAAIAA